MHSMNSTPSPVALAVLGALLFFLSGFIQGGLRTSADPELVLGFSEACRALGWIAVLAAGISLGRRA
jgi:hypothetical protein